MPHFCRRFIQIACLLAIALPGVSHAAVQVVTGATPIADGEARAAGDITVYNSKLAFSLAVQSAVPYGVPRGALVDIAPVVQGRIGRDRAVFADFVPNNWSGWPNSYQHVEIVERSAQRAIVRISRDWGAVGIVTTYTLNDDADQIEIQTTMTNNGATTQADLLSGFTLWPKGGFLFSVPGMADTEHGKAEGALADRVVAYAADWSVALHAPYFNFVSSWSKDMLQLHTLQPGEARSFAGWLQVGSQGDLTPVIRAEIERKHAAFGALRGAVTQRDGKAVARAVVVVEKAGKPYAWVLGHDGHYDLTLPVGDYRVYATAKGFSQSEPVALQMRAGAHVTHDFHDLHPPGRIQFKVTDSRSAKPLDARIVITQGQKPVVEFLGRKTFFTQLDRAGNAEAVLAPGSYVFSIASGGGFLTPSREMKLQVRSGQTQIVAVKLTPQFDPAAQGWYSADLHHHADQAEAATPPPDLARSQLAAGLDLLFVSDHDSTVNHAALQKIAARRRLPFLASMEISPSWGHFNAYPLRPGQPLAIDPSTATVAAVFAEARRQGAVVIQANHPFIPYGYFASLDAGVVPGGFDPHFDLVEINATVPEDDEKVLHKLWEFWNAGHHYYLTAGTDTHDVWTDESGRVRSFAHVEGKLTALSFAQSLQSGHAYVSSGPLIFPAVMFGDVLKVQPGESFALSFQLESLAGLKQVALIGGGAVVATKSFADIAQAAAQDVRAAFTLRTDQPTWYAVVVEDRLGKRAYSNPIWVDVISYPPH